ncbi:hypothetical protein D9619_007942 [Psilocybe cf. subviscida]|uniref:NAD-dependent epimerase/dehydratase domain-containing protein n=1 Tax=Psilocybe cf. subviscida TaxID=2480587 RepID=A0A8H5AU86_9AGAR|nr:hypothetical protein D9619_007942 [Psilocybe cf. subviscida]
MSQQLVLVTGITGFIAGHVTERLIEQGYRVRGTVRSTKYQKLSKENIPGLEFTEVNDLATDDLTEALKGVSVVMHVAAPLPGKADAAGSIKTAVEGTLNVVRQAEKAGITKIVVTSTFGNMFPPSLETAYSGATLTDSDWGVTTEEQVIANASNPFYVYFGSKNLAERALWDFVAKHPHLDVTSINPGFVYGPYAKILPSPGSQGELGSNIFNWMLLNGSFPPAGMAPPWVIDARDIAKAHVAAIKLAPYSPANTKRFLVNGSNFEWSEAAEAVRKAVPEITTLPEASAYGGIPGPAAILDSSRAKKDLGLDDFIPPAQTFVDTLKDLARLRSEWAAKA